MILAWQSDIGAIEPAALTENTFTICSKMHPHIIVCVQDYCSCIVESSSFHVKMLARITWDKSEISTIHPRVQEIFSRSVKVVGKCIIFRTPLIVVSRSHALVYLLVDLGIVWPLQQEPSIPWGQR